MSAALEDSGAEERADGVLPRIEHRVRVPEGTKRERLDRFLSRTLGHSRAVIQRWVKQGLVSREGGEVESSDLVVPGWELVVRPAPPLPSKAEPDARVRFAVVFEDADLVIVDKPPGLVVHPGKGNWTGTLINGLLAREGFGRPPVDVRDAEGPLRPGIVHRIDKDTSGLLVVAKSEAARSGLMAQLAAHTVTRSYVAVTVGVPKPGRIETLHARHPRDRLRFSCRVAHGKRAVTDIKLVEQRDPRWALVRCRLQTGRTHQIRVHLGEHCNTPILADSLYGRSLRGALDKVAKELGRQALHAAELGFDHPVTGQRLLFHSPLPTDLENALDRLRSLPPDC